MGDVAGPLTGGNSPWLHETLYERRIVLVTGRLNDAVAARATAALVGLDATGEHDDRLQVDSSDGTLEAAFVLIDTLGMIRRPSMRCVAAWSARRQSVLWPPPATAPPLLSLDLGRAA